jgi:hypothetical protein
MPLINDIETVRANGVKVMFINDDSAIADMISAEERFIVPVLGDALYADLNTNIADPDFVELLGKVRRALAPLAYWLELPNIQTQITDRGTAAFASQNMVASPRWAFYELRESLADKGCYALENLLQYLFDNKAHYDWALPGDFKLIILTGKEFYNFFPVYQPHRTFLSLRPIIKQVEDQYIRTSIGDTFFEELRDKASPSPEENKAIALIKVAVANLAVKTACEILPVKISANGFTVVLLDALDKPWQGEQQAPGEQMGMLYKSVQQTGQTYLSKLKDYLNENASANLFASYFSSIYYKAPAVAASVVDPNSKQNIFRLI